MSRTKNVYHGRNAADTRKLQSDLRKAGPRGKIAAEVFRAARASSKANRFINGGIKRSKGGYDSYSDLDFQKKTEALKKLSELLEVDACGLNWGWLEDEEAIAAPFLLLVDLPVGQVVFHCTDRFAGPDYSVEMLGGSQRENAVIGFCDSVLGDVGVGG